MFRVHLYICTITKEHVFTYIYTTVTLKHETLTVVLSMSHYTRFSNNFSRARVKYLNIIRCKKQNFCLLEKILFLQSRLAVRQLTLSLRRKKNVEKLNPLCQARQANLFGLTVFGQHTYTRSRVKATRDPASQT